MVMKCDNCQSEDIEECSQRGETVCLSCGSVLKECSIISEVHFEETADGGSAVVGKFLSADAKSASTNVFMGFNTGDYDSRQNTLMKAQKEIQNICYRLALNQQIVSIAHNYLKMALVEHNFTRGRKREVVYAACIYLTCRKECTSHMLIDVCDAAQVCSLEVGRTYLKLIQLFYINVPSVDPCLYVLRFANQLELSTKTNEVANLAIRLVQRMKRDSLHSGRRPSGLCGAALLLAARLYNFHRTVNDIVQIVKIHHSTLKKRLQEFRDTPSSCLTVDEFLDVDLEEEQAPPSFRDARKKDKERAQKIWEENPEEFDNLRQEIEKQLEIDNKKNRRRKMQIISEDEDEDERATNELEELVKKDMIKNATLEVVEECVIDDPVSVFDKTFGIGPDIDQICNAIKSTDDEKKDDDEKKEIDEKNEELSDLDDGELNKYLLSEEEAKYKEDLWMQMNESYLTAQKTKKELAASKKDEQPMEKKRRRTTNSRKRGTESASSTASEAFEKMLNEKKLSSKINYDVLKSLEIDF